MSFPAEAVPDGAIFAPHHLTWGAVAALVVVGIVADNYPHREPLAAMWGLRVALFGFLFVWPFYPATGAGLTLAGLTLALTGVLWPGGIWADYPLRCRVAALVAVCVAADDALSHAFGVWTPVDALWKAGIYSALP